METRHLNPEPQITEWGATAPMNFDKWLKMCEILNIDEIDTSPGYVEKDEENRHMTIICGDCLEVMKTLPDNHFSAIVTDSPYGISFMGKQWDHGIPSIEYWREMLRIVKPGGHLLAAGLPRMMHRLISVIEDAGWKIRDLLMHLFGSGFPKSHNHFGIDGYGTALKPAWEGWSLAMKPLDGTFKQNAEKWGQAGINIDGTRIPSEQWKSSGELEGGESLGRYGDGLNNSGRSESHSKGRWPANILFDEEAAKMLDEQTGILKSGETKPYIRKGKNPYSGGFGDYSGYSPSTSGGASRFFYVAKASSRERNEGLEEFPFSSNMRVNGPRESEEEKTITKVKNHHPTVKPLSLMRYLITLIAPPSNALILDPFAGSGSTIVAAKQLGIDAIGIEKETEYCDIARARLESYQRKIDICR